MNIDNIIKRGEAVKVLEHEIEILEGMSLRLTESIKTEEDKWYNGLRSKYAELRVKGSETELDYKQRTRLLWHDLKQGELNPILAPIDESRYDAENGIETRKQQIQELIMGVE